MDPSVTDARWMFDDPVAGERAFRVMLDEAQAAGNTALRTEALTQIARAQGLQGRVDEAHSTLREAETLVPYAGARARIRHLLELGRLHVSAGDPAVAAPLFREAWSLASAAGEDLLAIDAAHMLGIVSAPDEQAVIRKDGRSV